MKNVLCILSLLLVLFGVSASNRIFAINENDKQSFDSKKSNIQIKGQIEYNDIVEKAKSHSFDLKAADFNILISKQGIRDAKSEYYPKLNLGASTEYTKNFRDQRESSVMSIGDSFINPYTRFQSVLGINLSYNIFDFGVRRNVLNMAKEDVEINELEEKEQIQDVIINVTDSYAKILMLTKQNDLYKKIEEIQEKNLEYYERLYDAKVVSSNDLNFAKVNLEQTKKQINEIKSLMEEAVSWLSFYTGEEYDINNLKVSDFEETDFNPFMENDIEKSIVWKLHEKTIKKKGYEVKAAQRLNYPKVTGYSRYYLYGSDYSSYPDSIKDIQSSNFSVGGSINIPVFDGFKNSANIKTKKLELEKLMVERDKALAEYGTKLAVMRSNLIYLNKQSENDSIMERELVQKVISTEKLTKNRVASPIDLNNAKIELLKQNIETVKNNSSKGAIIRGIEVLTREY